MTTDHKPVQLGFLTDARLSARGAVKTGVVVLNFGGPQSEAEVEPFLFALFNDPDVIRLPGGSTLQRAFAERFSRGRAEEAKKQYREIGFSPLVPTTMAQVVAVQAELSQEVGSFYTGMRYTAPTIEAVVAEVRRAPPDRLIALALFPHYSDTTTGSSFNALARAMKTAGLERLPVLYIPAFYDHPLYLCAMQDLIEKAKKEQCDPRTPLHLLFSAHGLPSSYFRSGDPYPNQIQESVRLLIRTLGWQESYSLSFQSKVGPVRWLTPSTEQELARLASEGVKQVLAVPLSFTTEGIETLFEVDVTFRRFAEARSLRLFRVPAVGTHPDFIRCLVDLLRTALADDRYQGLGAMRCVRCLLPKPHAHRTRAECPDCGHVTPHFLLQLPPVQGP